MGFMAKRLNQQSGFTLVEIVIVIIVLGILTATALPRFISLSSDARSAAITQVSVSAQLANQFIFLKSKMPTYSTQVVENRDDLLDIDSNGDGVFDTRLKWNYLDNTDIEVRVDLSADFEIEYEGISSTYIGYDLNKNNVVQDDNCYFKYVQASSASVPPEYSIASTGC